MAYRGNEKLNRKIEEHIEAWRGTPHGTLISNMYKSGFDYESICEAAYINIEDYEEE